MGAKGIADKLLTSTVPPRPTAPVTFVDLYLLVPSEFGKNEMPAATCFWQKTNQKISSQALSFSFSDDRKKISFVSLIQSTGTT